MDKKTIILFIVLIAILIGVVLLLPKSKSNEEGEIKSVTTNETIEEYVDVLGDGTKLNNSEELGKTKTFQGLTIKNIQLTNKDNKTELIANIENPTTSDKQAMLIDIVLKDKDGKEITTLGGRISPIKAGQTVQFSTSAMIDYANIYDFEFKLK